MGKTMGPMLGKERTDRLETSEDECQLLISGMSPRQQLALFGSGEPQSREACCYRGALEMRLRG